ncbi:MAG TPA: hypothetical protein VGR07_17125, partial [Thermoanaerobaculia bacterium]|nr:hypothetical protein [Thermoanaerobaculia bacterium]
MRGSRLIAAVSLGAGLATLSCAVRHPGLAELVQSAGPRRLVEPRLTGGFTYSPCRRTADAADLVPEARCAALPAAGSRRYHRLARIGTALKDAADRQPSAENLRAYALVVLVDRERHIDRALADLERAVEEAPGRADLLSDLAAAYLLRAERRSEPYDLILALVVADRAVAADATLAEARFNRALILDSLFLATAARSAWQDYLAVDPTSDWATEARAHIAALDRQLRESTVVDGFSSLARLTEMSPPATVDRIVQDNPQAARMYAEIQLLGGWAERLGQGQGAAAAATLSVARHIGRALARTTGERMLQDAVATIDAAIGAHDPRLAGLL